MKKSNAAPPVSRRAFIAGAGVLAALSAAGLAGCGGSGSNAAATVSSVAPKKQVTIAMSTDNEPAAGFDPCINWGCGEHVHEPLVPTGSTKKDGENECPAGNDVTCNLEVRQAISYGIDRKALIDNVLNGYGSEAYGVGDGMPWANPDMRCETDLGKAAGLLEAAGWAKGADGVYAKDGRACAFDPYYPSTDSVRQAMANEFANQMGKLGIKVTTKGGSWDDLYPHEFSDPIMWGWGSNSLIDDDAVTHAVEAFKDADGLVLGTPVYWASPTGEMELFMDHLWGKANRELLAGKPCAVLATARRAGTTSVIDGLAKYPTFAEMPIVSLFYWPMVHGNTPDEVLRDEEGVQIMQQMGANMAWMLKCFEAGRAAGIEVPAAPAKRKRTNFVR